MDVVEIMKSCGFESFGSCDASALVVRPEVRSMCAADICHSYNANWSCPPACGALEEYQAIINSKATCYLAQTVRELEDSFDLENMLGAAEEHSDRFSELYDKLLAHPELKDALVLGAGACTLCEDCTYPDAPCRFPHKRIISMEAAGLVVSEVCVTAGVPYNHGANTISYTGCVLV